MLHVASDAAIRALNRSRQPAPQPPQAAQAPATPFSSLLDDNAVAPRPTRQPATDDNVASARSDKSSNDKTAKVDAADAGKDGKRVDKVENNAKKSIEKTAKATKSDKPDKSDETDKGDQPGKTAKTDQDDEVATDAKTIADDTIVAALASQDAKPSDAKPSDGKPADLRMPVDIVAAPPADPTSVIKSPNATVATVAPAVVATPTPAPMQAAAKAETPAPGALVAAQSDTDITAGNPALGAKTVAVSHNPAKPQEPAANADDEPIAHVRGEVTDRHTAAARTLDALTTDTTIAPKAAPDLTSALPALSQNSPTAANSVTAALQPPQAAAIPLSGIAIEIAGKAASGKNHFEIRLDPSELGRIEVHLAVDHDGNVTSRMIADRTDTLDLLRRDASGLERALQDAGLKTANNSLQFSLRDQSAYQQQQQGFAGNDATHIVVEDETLAAADIAQSSYNRLAGIGGGLDIQV